MKKGEKMPFFTRKERKTAMNKEFLYVGYYVDTEGNTILKIGTTNNLKRRQQEHTRNYKRAKEYTMPKNENFTFIWHLPLSKYNTLRYEDKNREEWKNLEIGTFIRNDRFKLKNGITKVPIKIIKNYEIMLDK